MKRWLAWVLPLLLLSPLAHAHEMSMAEMELREMRRGDFMWQWTASGTLPRSAAPAMPAR